MARRMALALAAVVCLAGAARAEITRGRKIAIAVVVSVGVAATAGGAAMVALGLEEYNAAPTAGTIADYRRMTRDGNNLETAGVAMLVVGGLVGNLGGIMLGIVGSAQSKRRARLWIAPTGNGAMVGGSF
ncbi:MAG TPA: hypothetical protein VFF06_20860 [Polyangia bacterium]|nr:hypothetical protein [Polyangia bacterium]